MNGAVSTEQAVGEFARLIAHEGTQPALRYLNSLGPYRYTGIFERHGDWMRNLHFVDRDDASITQIDDIRGDAGYCSYAMSTGEPFTTCDAAIDPRLEAHPARGQMRSYCGVPLFDSEGQAFGTLCSFDSVPTQGDGIEPELMLQLPPLFLLHGVFARKSTA